MPIPAQLLTAKFFLCLMGMGLSLIGTTYGLFHHTFIVEQYGLDSGGSNNTHLFRAVMGLYWGISAFWLICAGKPSWQQPAVLSAILIMLGLAAGRIVSMSIDGTPHLLLIAYTGIEIFSALHGSLVYKKHFM